ncbi:MAG: 3-oxo-tetronate 4-phosphate decarboxylase [Pseudomonadota bacterium]
MTRDERRAREHIVRWGERLHIRGYAPGSSGNIALRVPSGTLVTPTNSCLGFLDPQALALVAADGTHLDGLPPSKEAFLHLAMLAARPGDTAVVHLHSTHAVGVSCLQHGDEGPLLEPLTAYSVMKVGALPLVPYYPPGDRGLADAVAGLAAGHPAQLLANHGPVVAGADLNAAVFAIEELEEAARLMFLTRGLATRPLDADQLAELNRRFPS